MLVFLAALLAETLAVGLGMPGLAGIVLLAVAATPLGIRPAGPLALLLAGPAVGWLLLLAVDQAARIDALPRLGSSTARRNWPSLAVLSTAAISCTALLLVVLAPSGTESPWLRSWWSDVTAGPSGQGGPNTSLDPFVDVRTRLSSGSPREILRYTSSDGEAKYLGMVTLERFDGTAWTPYPLAPGQSVEQPAPGAGTDSPEGPSLDIRIATLANPYLPVPDQVAAIQMDPGGQRWAWDLRTSDVVSTDAWATGSAYRARTSGAPPAADALAGAGSQSTQPGPVTQQVPASMPPDVAALAAQVTAEAATNYDRALALQRWFTAAGGFEYSLTVPPSGERDPLSAFLEDRVGFCQQFATAMAAMARTLGIPARVVVGFTGGSQLPDGSFIVTTAHAHAWPELWFDGFGWVRFEPTPASASAAVAPPPYAPELPDAPEPTAPPQDAPDAAQVPPEAPGTSTEADTGAGAAVWWPAALAAALACSLLMPVILRRRLRRKRLDRAGDGEVLAAWQEVAATAVDAQVVWPRSATLRQQADALIDVLSERGADAEVGAAVWQLVGAMEVREYAPAGAVPLAGTGSAVITGEPGGPDMDARVADSAEAVIGALDALPRTPVGRVLPRSLRRH